MRRRIRSGRRPNCLTFAADWEVSQKTVQRDIDFLQMSVREIRDGTAIDFHIADNRITVTAVDAELDDVGTRDVPGGDRRSAPGTGDARRAVDVLRRAH